MDGCYKNYTKSIAQMWTIMWTINAYHHLKYNVINNLWDLWRRRWDSNPRNALTFVGYVNMGFIGVNVGGKRRW